MEDAFKSAYREYVTKMECDVFMFLGPMYLHGVDTFLKKLKLKPPTQPKISLIFSTYGGDAHAAYRLARRLSKEYSKTRVIVDGPCKSAGTLFAIGSDELACGDKAEFGPIDVQLLRKDELVGRASGLDTMQAFETVLKHVFPDFEGHMLSLQERSFGAISTKMACDVAAQLTLGTFQPILSQIDPYRLGEVQRHLQVAEEYGRRLDDIKSSMRSGALEKLLNGYPTHAFIIDRSEAEAEIFQNVTELESFERILCDTNDAVHAPDSAEKIKIVDFRDFDELKESKTNEASQPTRPDNGEGVDLEGICSDAYTREAEQVPN